MTKLQQDVSHTDDFAKHKYAKQILTQNRIGVGKVTFRRKGPMCLQSPKFLYVLYFLLLFLETQPLISLKLLCLLVCKVH